VEELFLRLEFGGGIQRWEGGFVPTPPESPTWGTALARAQIQTLDLSGRTGRWVCQNAFTLNLGPEMEGWLRAYSTRIAAQG
jgi:hypothetical protein